MSEVKSGVENFRRGLLQYLYMETLELLTAGKHWTELHSILDLHLIAGPLPFCLDFILVNTKNEALIKGHRHESKPVEKLVDRHERL